VEVTHSSENVQVVHVARSEGATLGSMEVLNALPPIILNKQISKGQSITDLKSMKANSLLVQMRRRTLPWVYKRIEALNDELRTGEAEERVDAGRQQRDGREGLEKHECEKS
jgi:hypothetical protein